MDIVISNIPDGATVPDLRQAFKLAIKTNVFKRLGKLLLSRFRIERDARFRLMRRKSQGLNIRFAYVVIENAQLARLFIEALHGHTVRGQQLVVREHLPRVLEKDRRTAHSHAKSWSGVERRSSERRNRKK